MRSLPVRFDGCDVRCDTFYSDFENRNVVGCSLDLDVRLPPGVGVVGLSLDLDARLPPRLTAAAAGSAPPAAGALDGNV